MRATRLSRRALLGAALGTAIAGTAGTDPLDAQARRLLAARRDPRVDAALRSWPADGARRDVTPSTVPVLAVLPAARDAAPAFSAGFLAALAAAAPGLAWRRSYTESQVSAAFLAAYGWTELIGLTGPLPSARLACGVLALGPGVTYPLHHHEADELYVPLSGVADWRHGTAGWVTRRPGEVIHHAQNESHAMRTTTAPLVALYLWQSSDLAQKSRLDDPGSGG